MSPLFKDGEMVLVDPNAYRSKAPEANDIVIARHPFIKQTYILKRVVQITEDGQLELTGENRLESTDSHSFGAVSRDSIVGRVTSRVL